MNSAISNNHNPYLFSCFRQALVAQQRHSHHHSDDKKHHSDRHHSDRHSMDCDDDKLLDVVGTSDTPGPLHGLHGNPHHSGKLIINNYSYCFHETSVSPNISTVQSRKFRPRQDV